jgi:50S ribosomal subunit-associated GTPase HflX
MSGYKERDAAKDTDESPKRVGSAWHQARDDAQVRGDGPGDRPTEQNRVDAERKMREILDRARARQESDREQSRGERDRRQR